MLAWQVFDSQGRFMVNTLTGPANGNIYDISNVGIVAHAGGLAVSATQLNSIFNYVDTTATTGDSVKLLPATLNVMQVVKNRGVADLYVYCQAGDVFEDAQPYAVLPSGSTLSVICNPNGTWNYNP